nr:hypothetical protein Iba_chr11bCG8600 [Ipomoea batatas]GME02353.1 hypothetical protein Iba_scaffold1681811CG0010 [Ipomoea batatas]
MLTFVFDEFALLDELKVSDWLFPTPLDFPFLESLSFPVEESDFSGICKSGEGVSRLEQRFTTALCSSMGEAEDLPKSSTLDKGEVPGFEHLSSTGVPNLPASASVVGLSSTFLPAGHMFVTEASDDVKELSKLALIPFNPVILFISSSN